jgi:hypothetical protein
MVIRRLSVSMFILLGGCSTWHPAVRPYEREHLSDPSMRWDTGDFSRQRQRQALEIREGARGATGTIDDVRGRP